jgi:DNA-binding PadR family transcriptional regulator
MRGSPYRGALLSMVIESPGHGYGLSGRLRHRVGPAFAIPAQAIYPLLASLKEHGLLRSSEEPKRGSDQMRLVYHPTEQTIPARDAWIASPLPAKDNHLELLLRVVFATPAHVADLEPTLDLYEKRCFAQLNRTRETSAAASSPRGYAIMLARAAAAEEIEARLRWIAKARDVLERLKASSPSSERTEKIGDEPA